MSDLLWLCVGAFLRLFGTRQDLLENLALRQQLAVLKRKHPRPRLGPLDKLFWVVVHGCWSQWKGALVLVLPETVSGWDTSASKATHCCVFCWLKRYHVGKQNIGCRFSKRPVDIYWGVRRIVAVRSVS
jgi:hypothetical protein